MEILVPISLESSPPIYGNTPYLWQVWTLPVTETPKARFDRRLVLYHMCNLPTMLARRDKMRTTPPNKLHTPTLKKVLTKNSSKCQCCWRHGESNPGLRCCRSVSYPLYHRPDAIIGIIPLLKYFKFLFL